MRMGKGDKSHGFSVELESKDYVKSMSLSNGDREGVLFEGVLGELEELGFLEGAVLFIKGSHGSLMVDLTEEELRELLKAKKGDA